jgi:hypothetical protein
MMEHPAEGADDAPAVAAEPARRGWWRYLSWLLVAGGLAWMGWALVREWPQMAGQVSRQDLVWIGLSLLLGSIAVGHEALAFFVLLRAFSPGAFGLATSFRLFATGQMIRHVPGRFWGVAYQMGEVAGAIPPLAALRVNVDLTLLVLAYSVLIPLAILAGAKIGWLWALLLLGGGLLVLALAIRHDRLSAALNWLSRRLGGRFARLAENAQAPSGYSWPVVAALTAIFLSHWLFYLLAWLCLGLAFPGLGIKEVVLTCAIYTLSWVVGFVSMITPSGLGVREATFAVLARPLVDAGNLASPAALAVYVRIWLLVIDLILFSAGMVLRSIRQAPPPGRSDLPSSPRQTPRPLPADQPESPAVHDEASGSMPS